MTEIRAIHPDGTPSEADGTLPHNVEAEQQLLGAILTNNDIYDRIASIIRARLGSTFFSPVRALNII